MTDLSAPLVFNVIISDKQRAVILRALAFYVASIDAYPDAMQAPENDREEGECLGEMLASLPEIEKNEPGVTHGLCY